MSKLAITYYRDIFTNTLVDLTVHENETIAIEHFKATMNNYFSVPIILKSKPSISKDKSFSVGTGLRSYKIRFLSDEEVEIYKQYNDDFLFDIIEDRMVSPSTLHS